MNKKQLICPALLILFAVASCSKEDFIHNEEVDPSVTEQEEKGTRVFTFQANLPNVTVTRAETVDKESLESCWSTCFNHSATDPKTPYFTNEEFDRNPEMKNQYSPIHPDKCTAPKEGGKFEFLAFFPSFSEMKMRCGIEYLGEQYFELDNDSTKINKNTLSIDYSIKKFRIAGDISKQVDFLTARSAILEIPEETKEEITEGQLPGEDDSEESDAKKISVNLDFDHQLTRVELFAWGNNDKYIYEFAGVRLGNTNVEGRFRFVKPGGGWINTASEPLVKGVVEYIYGTGDYLVTLDGTKLNVKDKAGSIMGKSGVAMVLPTDNQKWEGRADGKITEKPYNTTKSYISVLLRVRKKDNKKILYPYIDNDNFSSDDHKMSIVYLAVKSDGEVESRLYPDDNGNVFYTDREKTQLFTPEEGTTVKEFGWAAIPLDMKWDVGKQYKYKLNFTNGIGLHDPTDPDPGTPIVEQSTVPVTVDVNIAEWGTDTEKTIEVKYEKE